MSTDLAVDIKREFLKSKIGISGVLILLTLIVISIFALISIPSAEFQDWNNPEKWISYPKTSVPAWVNIFMFEKIPEHKIIQSENITNEEDGIFISSQQFRFNYAFDDFPNDFMYNFELNYTGSPLLEMTVIRPDGIKLELLNMSLPHSSESTNFKQTIFSTDSLLRKNLDLQSNIYEYEARNLGSTELIFSEKTDRRVLTGDYVFIMNAYNLETKNMFLDSNLIIGGKAFGVMGTDELRRDLAVGLLYGTPLALFIGISVSIGSVVAGLIYGVYSGYKGKKTDEVMMRFNDVIYALPALPFLIILAVTISNSIFLMIGFLMIFSWVGIAKVSRSISLQIKTRQYVEAAKIMGQKDSKIIFKHIIPQMLPYVFASIAISVPAAITTEAGLSFLGLGDPSFPTWGQILHDANTYGAAAQGFWWWIMPPGLLIAITGLAFVFIGNTLDTIINPKLKR